MMASAPETEALQSAALRQWTLHSDSAMNMYDYCKIFVRGAERGQVEALLATSLGHEFERDVVYLGGLVVEVGRNSDGAADAGDDFVRWPTLVELEAEERTGERTITETTATILRTLWDAGYTAVAACDFEDELPWSGGIRRLRGDPGSD